jgi:3',5'-cyclic AMP phosphodiesterase CpdA
VKPLRIAHLSDIHFGSENVVAVAAATARLLADPPDLVIASGDLTRFGEKPEFAAAAAWLESLPQPRLVTPGNHDAPYLAWIDRIFTPFARFERTIGPAEVQTHLAPGLAVYGLNTARGVQPRANWSKGQISRRQVAQAERWFAQAPADALKIVVLHHPLTEVTGGPMTGRVWGGPHAARAFARAGVDLVLSGHVHVPFAHPYSSGDTRTYAIGAGTLSVRERGVPAGFNMMEIDGQAIRVVALAWSGSDFEPYRTWSMDRRADGAASV